MTEFHRIVLATAAIVLSLGAAPTLAQSDDGEVIFFVELAESATLADGRLTLHGVDETVIWFSDRPFRDTGSVEIARLIDAWDAGDHSFADDPPNAVLTGKSDAGEMAIVVELTGAAYQDGTLAFTYVPLADDHQGDLANVSLFIDAAIQSIF